MSSTRLPGKVMKPLLGREMILHQIDRILRSKKIDKLIVATSQEPEDDPLAEILGMNNIEYYRGNLDNVLERFYNAAALYHPKHVVRLTGDCPLTDPDVIDNTIAFYLDGDFDYVSNCVEPSFPDGLDLEIFSFSALKEAFEKATLPSHLEHVTPFINKQPERYKAGVYKNPADLSHMRWTVDEPEDFQFVEKIYEKLYPLNKFFKMEDVLALLEEDPALTTLNENFLRNEGLQKSIKKDKDFIGN